MSRFLKIALPASMACAVCGCDQIGRVIGVLLPPQTPAPESSAKAGSTNGEFHSSRLIVRLSASARKVQSRVQALEATFAQTGVKLLAEVDLDKLDAPALLLIVELPDGMPLPEGKRIIDGLPDVVEVSFDRIAHLSALVEDPTHKDQWGLEKIGFKSGYHHPPSEIIGQRVTVAVLDGGIATKHPDLSRMVLAGRNFSGKGLDDDYEDRIGHGTHVAGIIGALGEVVGAAGGVKLLPVKVFDDSGRGSTSAFILGLQYAVSHQARVVNMSFGYPGSAETPPVFADAITDATRRGVLVVGAAGNEAGPVDAPATHPDVLAVSATMLVAGTERFADKAACCPGKGSSFGPKVFISAPGDNILSTWAGQKAYEFDSGTSMAAPFVSAAAALIWAVGPDLTRDQVIDRLRSGVDDLGPPGRDPQYGFGRLNLKKALTPSTIQPLGPKFGEIVRAGSQEFNWATIPGVGRYHLMICKSQELGDCLNPDGAMEGLEPEVGKTRATVDLPPGNWWWAVRGIAAGDYGVWGPYSTVRSVRAVGIPPAPSLIRPDDSKSTLEGRVAFSWNPSPEAARYHLMVCRRPDLSDCINPDGGMYGLEPDPGATGASLDLVRGVYFWAVRAIAPNDLGGWGLYSETRTVTIVPVSVATRVKISPTNPGPIHVSASSPGDPVFPTSLQLSAEVDMSDGKKSSVVTWTSSAPEIAVVGPTGLVEARSTPGTATITANSEDGKASATVLVEVRDGGQANVEVQ